MSTHTTTRATSDGSRKAYAALIGVTSIVILLQAVWAGLFVHEGRDYNDKWVSVHARGADLAILLAIVATVLVLVRLRERKDLLYGTAAMAVLLILEAYIGGLIGNSPNVTIIHFPLAMGLMGLAVWLPFRATRH